MNALTTSEVVFLIDVDNTLLDNDRIIADLRRHLECEFGLACTDRYWSIFEALRTELGHASYLGALQRYRVGADRDGPGEQQLPLMSRLQRQTAAGAALRVASAQHHRNRSQA